MNKIDLSIIVPTYNSSANISNFLQSCINSSNKNFEIIINDDKRTNDNTSSIIQNYKNKLNIVYINKNISMAQARKTGAHLAKSDILLHLDSDMELSRGLVQECIDKINNGADALVIPEESFGTTFWAKCKWLEKKCYENVDEIESLRCIKNKLYKSVNGHNPDMVFSEDKDLDLRIREIGAYVERTDNNVKHNEGDLRLLRTLRKKLNYSYTASMFANEHPLAYEWQKNIFNRYSIYFKHYQYFFKYPLVYLGMIFMKTAEFAAGLLGLIKTKSFAYNKLKHTK